MKALLTISVVIFQMGLGFEASAEPLKSPVSWLDAQKIPDFLPSAVLNAGNKVEYLDNGSACSGQFTSNSGHFLSAMHCMMKSILNRGPELFYQMGNVAPHYKGWYVADHSKLPYQTEEIPDVRFLHVGEEASPVVIAIGRGYFEIPPLIQTSENFDYISTKATEFSKFQEDYAILQFKVKKPEIYRCIPTRDSFVSSGEDAWVVGFPQDSKSDGQSAQKFVTKGKIFLTIMELKNSRGLVGRYPEEAWMDTERFMLFSASVKFGMSGGAVLDKEGKLIGTIVARLGSGETVIMKTSFVKSEVQARLGLEKMNEIFNCEE